MKILLSVPLLLLAACSSMEWRKDGASPETALGDWAACRREAELRVPPEFPMAPSGPVVGPSGVVAYPTPMPPVRRDADVLGMAQSCMRDKGYRLEPSGK